MSKIMNINSLKKIYVAQATNFIYTDFILLCKGKYL